MKGFLDFVRFILSPLQEWATSAYFARDLFFLLFGITLGMFITLAITSRWR